MDNTKQEVGNTEGMCSCQKIGKCDASHRYCFKCYCVKRCIIAVLVVAGAFALGFAAGDEGERHHRGFEYGYRGEHMMMEGRGQWREEEEQEVGHNPQMTQRMQYMMGRPVQATTPVATSAPVVNTPK